jgi:two-component system LytT family response regulator
MPRLRAVVVEDQPIARAHIASMLEALDVEVIATCANGLDAVQCVPSLAPDAVFMDVEMPELSAFEVIDAIGVDQMPPVVFITAYGTYSLRAFDVFASGYLVKPVATDKLAQVVERLRRAGALMPSVRRGKELAKFLASSAAAPPPRLVVRRNGRIVFVRVSEIECIEASGNYALIYGRDGCYQMRETMQNLQRRLGATMARIHRSFLVNLEYIVELRAVAHGEYEVVLRSGRSVRVTRRFRLVLQGRLREQP